MSHTRPARRAAIVLAAAVLFTIFPASFVQGADETASGDGYVINVVPRQMAVQDASVLVSAISTEYVFDVSVYDTDGTPVDVTQWGAVVEALDGSSGHANCAGSSSDQCVWATGGHQDPSSTFTLRVPVGAVNFMTDFAGNGVHLFVTLHRLGDGSSAAMSDGTLPSGSVSLLAANLVRQGDFADADQADSAWNPVFLLDAQPRGLVQPGNPIVNGGFELGANDGTQQLNDAGSPAYPSGTKVAFAGWALRNYDDDFANGQMPTTPSSTHFYTASNGISGAYADIWYSNADNGHNTALVQEVGSPQGMTWVGTAASEACFDAKVGYGSVPSFKLTANIFTAAGGSSVQPDGQAVATIPSDYQWRHYCLPFSGLAGKGPVREFYFNFDYGSSQPVTKIGIDNVELHGFQLVDGVAAQNDLNDGFSVFITPIGAMPGQSGVAQDLQGLAGGQKGYVYDLAATDYTSGSARPVDVAHSTNVAFELIDQSTPTGATPFETHLFDATSHDIYQYLDSNGHVSDHVLVVAPAAVGDSDLGAVPWAFVKTPTDYTYTSTFGSTSEPTSGYYSPARNALAQFSLADALDYDATPVMFTGNDGATLASAATVTLACHGQVANTSCYNAASPSAIHLDWTFKSASRVLEPTSVRLVSASNPTLVLGSAVVPAQGGMGSFTVLPSAVNQLVASAHNYRVKVVSDKGTFVEAGSSQVLDLANLAPVAKFTQTPGAGITRLTRVTLTDTSTDSDGSIASRVWNVTFTKPDTTVVLVAQGTGKTLSFTPPYVGSAYAVTLTVMDNGGASNSATPGTFTVANIAPKAALAVPANSLLGPVVFTDKSVDPDGVIASREYSQDGGATWSAPSLAGTYTVTPTADGPITVIVRVTDADNGVATANATTLVDGSAPTTTLAIAPNATNGWYTGPVAYKVVRSDVGSGIAKTVLSIDGHVTDVTGTADITGNVTGDGEHNITVFSVDKAGNIESTVSTAVFKIDTTAPTAAFTNPEFAGPIGGVYMAGEAVEMTVAASDATSAVTSVVFTSNGEIVCTDTDATDGFSCDLDTTDLTPGLYQLQAIATNAAGLSTATDSVEIVVLPGVPSLS